MRTGQLLRHVRPRLWCTFSVQQQHVRCLATAHGHDDVLSYYCRMVGKGKLVPDENQLKVAQLLRDLQTQLRAYEPASPTILQKWFSKSKPIQKPQGLYIYGAVGRGKTMLMDLFFESIPMEKKQREHFHEFMLDVHSRIHTWKQQSAEQGLSRKSPDYDPIPPVARAIGEQSWLLCLDEFQVTDIGDAMILKRLFKHLFAAGTVVVSTSNRKPEDLYKNGLQRSNFLPFIDVLKNNCMPVALDSGIDYRLKNKTGKDSFFFVLGECEADKELDRIFKVLASQENDIVRPRTLTIKGHNVSFKKTCGQVLDCSFEELCDRAVGAVDYLALSHIFHTVIIRNVPQMTLREKTQARRFITLIDTFYDNKVRVVVSAAVPANQLFKTVSDYTNLTDENRKLMDDLGISDQNASIFSGEEEIFAFDRTISRLTEMQTEEYWNRSVLEEPEDESQTAKATE